MSLVCNLYHLHLFLGPVRELIDTHLRCFITADEILNILHILREKVKTELELLLGTIRLAILG